MGDSMNQRMRVILIAVSGAVLTPSLATGQAEALFGCYELQLSPWLPADAKVLKSKSYVLPDRVQLDSTQIPRRGYALRPVGRDPWTVHELTHWGTTEKDGETTVHLIWTTGFEAVLMWLSPRKDALVGDAETWIDYPVDRARRTVRAVRIPCEPTGEK